MKKTAQVMDLLLGVLYLSAAIVGYFPAIRIGEPIRIAEWCCITGIGGGVFYLYCFALDAKNRPMPEILHLNVTLVLSLILITTLALRLNLEGVFWFIHVFGPAFSLLRFFLFCDCRKIKRLWYPLTVLVFPICYIFCAFFLLKMTGKCPFPASLILQWKDPMIPRVIIAALCVILAGICYGMFYLNISFKQLKAFKNK